MKEKGVSPVIATVLLIAMVVAIGLIVFLWFRGIIQEEGTKFDKNVKLNCPDIDFESSYASGSKTLSVVNRGNVPIYRMRIKIFKSGGYDTKDLRDDISLDWPKLGLNQGGTFSTDISSEIVDAEKIVLIPVLMGSTSQGKKTYVCEEIYGREHVI